MPLFSPEPSSSNGVLASGYAPHALTQVYMPAQLIAGSDEAGRGPLVGSVVAAAVILDPHNPIVGLDDSKKLSEAKRNQLYQQILDKALCYSIAEATHHEIDQLNILHASLLAMQRAIESLPVCPSLALIDGNKIPKTLIPCQAVVKGDALHACIGAASILAKVTRDRQLVALDRQYPQYGFADHKGYPTAKHLAAIAQHGVLAMHRRSFGPVKKVLVIGAQ